MNVLLAQSLAGAEMAGVIAVLVLLYRRCLAAKSERRLLAMLDRVGLDPALESRGDVGTIRDIEAIMKQVRQRCRTCSFANVCERWLQGEGRGNNDFCPNSGVFGPFRK
jgi:hypothetical protein